MIDASLTWECAVILEQDGCVVILGEVVKGVESSYCDCLGCGANGWID